MRLFEIDDGAEHWVIAADEADALAVWRPWSDASDEEPAVRALTRQEGERVSYWEDDPSNVVRSMWAEYKRDPTRRYVACSEL